MELNNGPFHIAEYFYNKYISYPMLPYLSKTKITPNMITILNMVCSIITFYLAYNKKVIIVGIMMLMYQFFDNLDGNLARYKNMKSKLGARLDIISDFIFYNFIFIFLGINLINNWLIFILIFLLNFYGIFATYFIVPRLRRLNIVKRRGLKKYFIEKNIILGIDVGTIDVISFIFLISGKIKALFLFLIFIILLDILLRLNELKYNQNLTENKN